MVDRPIRGVAADDSCWQVPLYLGARLEACDHVVGNPLGFPSCTVVGWGRIRIGHRGSHYEGSRHHDRSHHGDGNYHSGDSHCLDGSHPLDDSHNSSDSPHRERSRLASRGRRPNHGVMAYHFPCRLEVCLSVVGMVVVRSVGLAQYSCSVDCSHIAPMCVHGSGRWDSRSGGCILTKNVWGRQVVHCIAYLNRVLSTTGRVFCSDVIDILYHCRVVRLC